MIIPQIVIFLLFAFVSYATEANITNNEQIDGVFNIEKLNTQNITYDYIKFINSFEMRNTRLCYLFKVFFDKPQYINYNNTLFIDIFTSIYEDPFISSADIELYYIKNKCYDKIYESKIILNDRTIRNIILTILFIYGIARHFFITIFIWFLWSLIFIF